LNKASAALTTKLAKEQERVSVAGSVVSNSVASSQIFGFGNTIKKQNNTSVDSRQNTITFEKFQNSCNFLMQSKFKNQQYA
jgi:hypothetical protein